MITFTYQNMQYYTDYIDHPLVLADRQQYAPKMKCFPSVDYGESYSSDPLLRPLDILQSLVADISSRYRISNTRAQVSSESREAS